MNAAPKVGVIMGSQSDWATMQHTAEILGQLGYDAARIEALAASGAIGLDKGWVPVTGAVAGGA